jgi:hypothetical protein
VRKKGKVPRVLLAIRVPEQLRRELRDIAAREDRKLGAQVTRAQRDHVERYRKGKGR